MKARTTKEQVKMAKGKNTTAPKATAPKATAPKATAPKATAPYKIEPQEQHKDASAQCKARNSADGSSK